MVQRGQSLSNLQILSRRLHVGRDSIVRSSTTNSSAESLQTLPHTLQASTCVYVVCAHTACIAPTSTLSSHTRSSLGPIPCAHYSCVLSARYFAFRAELKAALETGRRPALPEAFDDDHPAFARLMRKAWATDPNERPTFDAIVFAFDMQTAKPSTTTTASALTSAPSGLSATTRSKRVSVPRGSASKHDELSEPLLSAVYDVADE